MANNILVLDGDGDSQTVKSTDNAGVHTPHHNVDAVIPGTGATNLGKAQDAAAGSTDTGIAMLAVRADTPADAAGTDGDYERLQSKDGRLYVRSTADLPSVFYTGENASISNVTAEPLTGNDEPLKAGVWVQAALENTGTIMVTSSGGTTGERLLPGRKTYLPIDNVNKVYVLASVNGENASYWGS